MEVAVDLKVDHHIAAEDIVGHIVMLHHNVVAEEGRHLRFWYLEVMLLIVNEDALSACECQHTASVCLHFIFLILVIPHHLLELILQLLEERHPV